MKKIIGLILLVVVILIGAYLYFAGGEEGENPQLSGVSEGAVTNPWIEVLADKVTATNASGATTTLKTGDEIKGKLTLTTDTKGLANLYFPDGSVARIDSGTVLTVDEASYDRKNERLIVRITLGAGRVWSKILTLVTADSEWEVKTSNVAATVRGTAFGVAYVNGKSTVLGSQNSVSVHPRDQKIQDKEALVSPGLVLEFKDADVSSVSAGTLTFAAKAAPASLLKESWVVRFEAEDKKLDELIKQLEAQGLSGPQLRLELQKIIHEPFLKLQELQKSTENAVTSTQVEVNTNIEVKVTTSTKVISPTSGGGSGPTAVSLVISTANPLTGVKEGDTITFTAVVKMSDGSKKTVTEGTLWQVVGLIGSFTRPGVFSARLDASVAEFGTSSGSIVGSWKDPSTGKEFFDKTVIFSVNANLVTPTGQDG